MSSDRKRKGKQKQKEVDPAAEVVTAQLDFGTHRPLCAPRQQKLEDVPVLRFNLGAADFLAEYTRLIVSTLRRARKIAPALLFDKAVTPIGNPCNRPGGPPYENYGDTDNWGNSHYIIEMSYTVERDGQVIKLYDGMIVQIIFCDYNAYQVGFRRCIYDKWSTWYYISKEDFPLPFFLQENAIKLPFGGDYTISPDIGGLKTFVDIFEQFGWYPDRLNTVQLEEAFLASAVVLCEARRIVWIFMEVKQRILFGQVPSPLDCNLPGNERTSGIAWTEITDWSNDCQDVLLAVSTGEYKARTEETGCAKRVRPVMEKFGDLVAEGEESGHLSLLLRSNEVLAPEDGPVLTQLKNQYLNRGFQVADPMFTDDDDE